MKYQITLHIIAFSTLAIRIGSNEGCSLWHELEAGWCCHNTVLQTTQWLSLSVKREEPFPLTACTVKNLLQETFYRPDWNGRLRRQHVTSVSDGSKDSEETRLCQSHMEGRTEVRPDHSLALECPSPSPEWLKEKSKSESMQHLSRGQLTCFWWYSDKGSYLVGLLLSFTCITNTSQAQQ